MFRSDDVVKSQLRHVACWQSDLPSRWDVAVDGLLRQEHRDLARRNRAHAKQVSCTPSCRDGVTPLVFVLGRMSLFCRVSSLIPCCGHRMLAFGGAVLCVKFLPFGPFLCAGSVDRSTRVFHILTGEQVLPQSSVHFAPP